MKMTKIALCTGLIFASATFSVVAESTKVELNALGIPKDVAQRSWFNQSASYRFNNSPTLPENVGINKNAGAFIINNDDGVFQEVLVFGDAEYGGVLPPSVADFLMLIQPDKMYASGDALLAYSSSSKMAISWGHEVEVQRDVNTLAHISAVYPGADSFILISDNTDASTPYVREYQPKTGDIQAIDGLSSDDPVKAIYHTGGEIGAPHAWLAITNSGKVAVWGAPEAGGVMSKSAQVALDGAIAEEAYTTNDAFLVKTSDNHWVAWDGDEEDTTGAGDISELAAILLKVPGSTVQATKSAFAVTSSIGVAAWGDASCGGVIDEAASNVLNVMSAPDLYATTCSFIAVDITDGGKGKIAQWGDRSFIDSADNVGKLKVLAANDGAVIYDESDTYNEVLWSLDSALLSDTAANAFNITQIDNLIASADAYAYTGQLGVNHMLVSWADGETVQDATITCPTKPQLYSTQSPTLGDMGYFLSYHPNCGESDVTTWGAGAVSSPINMCGTGVDDTDPTNATGSCLKVATDAAGKWFTSTPSVALMNELNYTIENSADNDGDTYAWTYFENGSHGPSGGKFALFRQDGRDANLADGTGSQFDRWCQKLGTLRFGGKANWRRPTKDELLGLYHHKGNLWSTLGWPTYVNYWSSTATGLGFYVVHLYNGDVYEDGPESHFNGASCVSENP